jgi:hypothetical protein
VNVYRYIFAAKCPRDDETIIYGLEIRSGEKITVERIKEVCAEWPTGFQEDIAADLQVQLGGSLTLRAQHQGVEIVTELPEPGSAPTAPTQSDAAPGAAVDAREQRKPTRCLLGCHERGQCLADAKGTPLRCRIHPRPEPLALREEAPAAPQQSDAAPVGGVAYPAYCLYCEKEGHWSHNCWSTHTVTSRSNAIRAIPAPHPQAAQAQVAMTDAARDVLAERQRQINAEGWTPEHDDEHSNASMAVAAAAYALADAAPYTGLGADAQRLWGLTGWAWKWFKRKGHRSNLVRSGALMLAEIERLDRAALATSTPTDSKGAAS